MSNLFGAQMLFSRRMKLASLAVLLLSTNACTREQPVTEESRAQAVSQAAEATEVTQSGLARVDHAAVDNPLPFDLLVHEKFEIQADRTFVDEKGVERRKLELVVKDTHGDLAEEITGQMVARGFKIASRSVDENSVTRILVHRKGVWVPVTYRRLAGDGDGNAGVLTIQWPSQSLSADTP